MGPSALRIAGLRDRLEELGCRVEEIGTVHAEEPELTDLVGRRTRYLDEIADVCVRTRDLVRSGLGSGCVPLVLGGDHSLSMGTVAAVSDHFAEGDDAGVGVLWVDAHLDMNTPESTPSGNVHGMALAVLCGRGPEALVGLAGRTPAVPPERVCVLGARSVDPAERQIVRESGVRVFTMSEIDERGMAACMDEALERAGEGTAGIHLSFDLDAIDPLAAPGVGTPVAGGITYREAHLICEKTARSGRLVSLEIVELNPVLDDRNQTARVAVGLAASALGQTIL